MLPKDKILKLGPQIIEDILKHLLLNLNQVFRHITLNPITSGLSVKKRVRRLKQDYQHYCFESKGKIHSVHVPLILSNQKAEKDGVWLIPATHQRCIQCSDAGCQVCGLTAGLETFGQLSWLMHSVRANTEEIHQD
ncbi:hypothetical protein AV530_007689 [Patagioenas fasciata monilis]|uniref:Uncharacterized protein n=1 Tax=Patagioenas fasciata monilis TaxID=372326 RepID=A0A1V4JYR3_PATFA|nr:hypothetical protein AV530_007689 [Patagioenas fasciata monilis]